MTDQHEPASVEPGTKASPLAATGHFLFGIIIMLLPVLHTAMILMPWFLLRQYVSLLTLGSLVVALLGWILHANILRTLYAPEVEPERAFIPGLFLSLYSLPYLGSFLAPVYSLLFPGQIALLDLPLAFLTALIAFLFLRHFALPRMSPHWNVLFLR